MMGSYAVDLLAAGETNRVVSYRNGRYSDFDIEEALAMHKAPSYEIETVNRQVSTYH